METNDKKIKDLLKQATVLFVSVPFFTVAAMATAGRRAGKTGLRMNKTGKRIAQPGLRADGKQNKVGLRLQPGKRIGKTGAGKIGSPKKTRPVMKVK